VNLYRPVLLTGLTSDERARLTIVLRRRDAELAELHAIAVECV
jgi:hypothetical protein